MSEFGPTQEQISELLKALSTQSREVAALRKTTETQSNSIKWGRRFLVVAMLAIVAALGFGYVANDAADKAQAAIDLSNEQRDAARTNTCRKDNEIARNTRENLARIGEAIKASNQATFEVFRLFVTDPEELPRLEEFLAATTKSGAEAVDKSIHATQEATGFPDGQGGIVSERDCSLEGIERYLQAVE
jgi:hypothetical protein